jgi:hypothetical protein
MAAVKTRATASGARSRVRVRRKLDCESIQVLLRYMGASSRGMISIPGKCFRCSENPAFLSRIALVLLPLLLLGAGATPERNPPGNPTAAENARAGTRNWELSKPATHREIEGYASVSSVARQAKACRSTSARSPTFDIQVYRLGWYGGAGARRGPRRGVCLSPAGGARLRASDGLVACDWPVSYTPFVKPDCERDLSSRCSRGRTTADRLSFRLSSARASTDPRGARSSRAR